MSTDSKRSVRRGGPSDPFTYFSKAVRDSFGLSFGESAKDNCDRSCKLWDSCYAARIERLYPGLRAKLQRNRRLGATRLVNKAIARLQNWRGNLKWARISVDGSLPMRDRMTDRAWQRFVDALRTLIAEASRMGASWHIPVESWSKAVAYRQALDGLGVVVRRTSQVHTEDELIAEDDCRAWVVGAVHSGSIGKEETAGHARHAQEVARRIRDSGQTAVVCPAIAGNSKCGQCTACADCRVDVVLYPLHA